MVKLGGRLLKKASTVVLHTVVVHVHVAIIAIILLQLYSPAGENILDNILFGSFISVDLQQTEHSDYN